MKDSNETLSNFIHLKDKVFAEYKIIYHINDGYAIKELNRFSSKHQLLFQKFSSKIQQVNLMIVDSIFPIHLADVALEVFLNGVSSFREYSLLKKDFIVISKKRDSNYFHHKFYYFILHLLYSNMESEGVCKGITQPENLYYLKNESGQIDYYSFFQHRELQALLFDKIQLQINSESTFIKDHDFTLCLRISFP